MQSIKIWCADLIVVMTLAAVLRFFAPEGSVKKYAEIGFSLIILFSFLFPFKNIKNFSVPSFAFEKADGVYNKTSADLYSDALKDSLVKILDKNGVKCLGVSCDTELNGDGYFIINKVTVTLADGSEAEKAVTVLTENTELTEKELTVNVG